MFLLELIDREIEDRSFETSGNNSANDTASYPRRCECTVTPLWELQILYGFKSLLPQTNHLVKGALLMLFCLSGCEGHVIN
jgi:hypothetical protein